MVRREGSRELRGDVWSVPKITVKNVKEADGVLGDDCWWSTERHMKAISGKTMEIGKACRGGRREKEVEAGIGVEEWGKNGARTRKKRMARCLV